MPHTFHKSRHCILVGLVRAGRPRPAFFLCNQVSDTGEEPAGGSAADQGVRPTTYAGVSRTQKYAALGCHPAPHGSGAATKSTGDRDRRRYGTPA
jgi:hypothetical protein